MKCTVLLLASLVSIPGEGGAEKETWHDVIGRRGCDTPPSWNFLTQSGFFDHAKNRDSIIIQTLGEEFIRIRYRQREFLRILARTEAYQRESISRAHLIHFGIIDSPRLRRLPPHVTWDAWARWLPDEHTEAKIRTELPQVPALTHPLRLLGQDTREWGDETVPVISHELARFMMSSPLIEQVAAASSRALASATKSPTLQIEDLFLSFLGRFPDARETSASIAHLTAHPDTGHQDITWALLNTSEFIFQP